jgi:hypothetical protein
MGAAPIRCIYCRDLLDEPTHEAHVIPRCLGGRIASRSTCCNSCNNALGRIEDGLCSTLRPLSAALAARNAANKPITAAIQVGAKIYDYADGLGNERLPERRYDARTRSMKFPLPGGAEAQAGCIARMLWDSGLTPAAIDAGKLVLERDDTFGIRPHPPAPTRIETPILFGTEEHLRVAAKMALELLAVWRPEEGRRWGELRIARRFVRQAEGLLPVRVDSQSAGSGLRRPRGFPVLAHAVEVWTNTRNVHFRATFFGKLHATGTLATAWQGPRFSMMHALDPTRPGKHVNRMFEKDGPGLTVWHADLRSQAWNEFLAWFEVQTGRVSRRVTKRRWTPPADPDLSALRPLIDVAFDALCGKLGAPKPPGRKKRSRPPLA